MTSTNLSNKEQLVFAWRQYNDEDITFEEAEADIDRFVKSAQHQLLTELMEYKESYQTLVNKRDDYWMTERAVPVSVIERYLTDKET